MEEKIHRIRHLNRKGGVINTKFYQSKKTYNKAFVEAINAQARINNGPLPYKTYDTHSTHVTWT